MEDEEELDDWNREDYEIDEGKENEENKKRFTSANEFSPFLGNRLPKRWNDVIVNFDKKIDIVGTLCNWIKGWNRNPRGLILSGPSGSGKKTLAYMITKEANWIPVIKGFECITKEKKDKKTGEIIESDFFEGMSNKCMITKRLKALVILDLEYLSKSTKKGGGKEEGVVKKKATNAASKFEELEKRMPVIYICKDVWKKKMEPFRRRCTMVKLWTMLPTHLMQIAEHYAYDLIDKIDWRDVYNLTCSCQGNATRFVHQIKNWHPVYSTPKYQSIEKTLEEEAKKGSIVYKRDESNAYQRQMVHTKALKNEDECWVTGFNTPMEERENCYKSAALLFDRTKMRSSRKSPGDLLCSDGDSMETLYDAMWETYPLRCDQHDANLNRIEALERCSRLFSDSDLLESQEHNHRAHSFSGLLVASVGIAVEPYALLMKEPPKIQTTKRLVRSMWETRDSYASLKDARKNYVRCTGLSGTSLGFEFNGYLLPTLAKIIHHQLILSSNASKKEETTKKNKKQKTNNKEEQDDDETKLQERVMQLMTTSVLSVASEKSVNPSTFAGATPWFDFLVFTNVLEQEVWQRAYMHSSMGLNEITDQPSDRFKAWKFNFSGKKIKPQKITVARSSSLTPTTKNSRKRERFDFDRIDASKYRIVPYDPIAIEVFIRTDGSVSFDLSEGEEGDSQSTSKKFNVVSSSKNSKGILVKRVQLKL